MLKCFLALFISLTLCLGAVWATEYSVEEIFELEARSKWDQGDIAYKQENYSLALEQYKKAAAYGYPEFQQRLAAIYRWGDTYPGGNKFEKNFAEAMRLYKLAALQGNASAQNSLGGIYANGEGGEKNLALGIKYYHMAVDQGDLSAQANLAARYETGSGVPKDYAKALELYKLAAKSNENFTPAFYKIGIFYSQGLGVIQDYKEAIRWHSRAAEKGTYGWESQTALGVAYILGQGVPIDLMRAHMWFNIAALSNQDDPMKRRENIQNRMTPQQIEEAQRLAKECIASKYINCGLGLIKIVLPWEENYAKQFEWDVVSEEPISENVKANQLYEDLYGNKIESCQGPDRTRWSNCIGEWTAPNGNKYTGEFKDGKFNGLGTFIYFTGSKYVGEFKNDRMEGQGTHTFASGVKHVGEFKDDKFNGRGIAYSANGSVEKSGIFKDFTLVTSQYIDPNSFTRIAGNSKLLAVTDAKKTSSSKWETVIPGNSTAPAVTESQRLETDRLKTELEAERQRLAEERRKLDAQKIQIEQEKKSSRIAIKTFTTLPDANGDFTITIQTGADTASLKIDGEELGGKRDGKYVVKRVARVGEQNSHTITARDVFGNTDSATVIVDRQVADSRPAIPRLNPANVRVQQSRDAVAIIIGIENYRRVAKADFANADAKDFYTYASRALGIKPENIKLLVDDGADDIEMLNAFQNWLPLKVNKGKTDVYVFYSGHGFPSQDGKSLYFLPFNVDKQYLDRTSVKQKELVAALQKAQAKSVTMFIDACYSGQTRNGEVLVAGIKPVFITTEERAYPPEFTVITASAADQFSSASPDLKHGIFSFYLMKALEGDGDENKDGRITSGELQRYLSDMVGRQAMGLNRTQNTQLFGDADRVLVGR